jgi:flagellar biosynthetic protein FliO
VQRFKLPIIIAATLLSLGGAYLLRDDAAPASATLVSARAVPTPIVVTIDSQTATSAQSTRGTPLFRDYRDLGGSPVPPAATLADTPDWQVGLNLVVQLSMVLGLIYLTAWGLKKLRQRTTSMRGNHSVQLMETVALSPHRTLHVVAVGGRVLVLGATDHQINLITEMDALEPEEATAKSVTAATVVTNEFLTTHENKANGDFDALLRQTQATEPVNAKTAATRPATPNYVAAAYAAAEHAPLANDAMERLLKKLQKASKG